LKVLLDFEYSTFLAALFGQSNIGFAGFNADQLVRWPNVGNQYSGLLRIELPRQIVSCQILADGMIDPLNPSVALLDPTGVD